MSIEKLIELSRALTAEYQKKVEDMINNAYLEGKLEFGEVELTPTPPASMKGMWFKRLDYGIENTDFNKFKWYECVNHNPADEWSFIDNQGDKNGFYPDNHLHFDLTRPLPYNPNEGIKIEDMKEGEWYIAKHKWADWIIKFDYIDDDNIYVKKSSTLCMGYPFDAGLWGGKGSIISLRPALKSEVIKYFKEEEI